MRILPLDKVGAAYGKLRKSRATQVQSYSRAQRVKNHLDDGPDQIARDAALREPTKAMSHSWKSENGLPPKPWIEGLCSYDAEKETREFVASVL